ncbi:MAG: DUF4412 domain-containing protein [Bacteroidetes bacterium]|nr:DUF4412 domain-containing protein [Bacteroidota bacterium]MBS1933808.1 DUF4412 domain-containing protein [Bacteroidota bacterium]
MKRLFIFCPVLFFACTGHSSATIDKQYATAVASDASGSGGNDMYYEYSSSTVSGKMSIQTDTKMYVSAKGDMRSEMIISNPALHNGATSIINIAHVDKPNESITIDDSAKTYSINHFNDSDLVNTGQKMNVKSVTKIGEEKILGFNSVHARVIVEKSIGGFYSDVDTIDFWRSSDVPFLPAVKKLFDQFEAKTGNAMYPPGVAAQLKQLGCDGFMTKMEIHSKRSHTTEELVKAEHSGFPPKLFEVPAGYKQDTSSMF